MASSKPEEDSIDFSPLTDMLGSKHSKLKQQIPALGETMSSLVGMLGSKSQDKKIQSLFNQVYKKGFNSKAAKDLILLLQDRLFAEDGVNTLNNIINDAAKICRNK